MSDTKLNFQVANSDDPEGIIEAAKISVIEMLQAIVRDMKNDTKAPGLTWEQIEYLLEMAKKKKAIVYHQDEPL